MIGMNHTDRAPGEFQTFFFFLHRYLSVEDAWQLG